MGISSASAAPAQVGEPQILAKDLAGPLTTAVADDGTSYVTANFGGKLYRYAPDGTRSVAYKTKGSEVGGVAVDGDTVTFVVSGAKHLVKRIIGDGKARTIANLGAYERNNNPDAKTGYGFVSIPKACAAKWPVKDAGPPQYTGIIESHPYATEIVDDTVYVADAAGNDILAVSGGEIETVAVLPPTKVKVTRAAINAGGLPECVKGLTYKFEPVPTDVEMGPDGWLYVSSLPGGPEDGSLGAQGRVYKVNPDTGKVVLVASGFVSTVNVAVADNGDVFVSQLFAGSIVRIPAGTDKVKAFAEVSMPAGLEWTEDGLYATIDALKGNKSPKGKLAFIPFE
jgi:sugar lactone lactonase YvrE